MILKINDKLIGKNNPCFIIAEAGVNHNQKLDLAIKLVDIAADCGADAVKFQTFTGDDLVTKWGKMASYQLKNIGQEMTQREMLKSVALPEEYYGPIIKCCEERNILFMSTPHGGKPAVRLLEALGVSAYKIGSGDLTNYIILDVVAKTGKPVILSSGMATLEETKDAIRFIRSKGNNRIAMFHATTNYPCPSEEVNLLAMKTMMEELDVPVGYSDHTQGIQAAVMAATLGMALYECHFTLDKTLPGPDHIASAEPDELKSRIQAIRQVPTILGRKEKIPTKSEVDLMRDTVRKSIVMTKDLKVGHIITEDDLEAKRPGDGVSPTQYEKFLGKRLKVDFKKDEQITVDDIE